MAREPQRIRRRERKNITAGVAHVNASFNNTMITITDAQGNAISWSSAGMMGFKGSRKSTPYAAQVAADDAGKKAAEHGVRINAVAPSIAMHAFLAKVTTDELLEKLSAQEAFGRPAEVWEVANVMMFLASDLSSYMTGEIVSVSSQRA